MDMRRLNKRQRLIGSFVLIVLLLMGYFYLSSLRSNNRKAGPPPVPVVVATVSRQDVPVYLSALGVVTPAQTITVKTQIDGQLLRVLFSEGQLVKAGELLAEIDERPYEAQLIQFEGQLARDKALLTNAKLDLERYEKLYKEDSVSQQILDTQRSLVAQYVGTVKLDEGQIQAVRVNLIYCRIVSPIDGRVGLRLVDPGNFVKTTDTTGLFVLNGVRPITVIFTLPEDNIPQVLKRMKENNDLIVEAYDRAQVSLLATGSLLTIDNQIDPTTGTVKLRALFQNQDDQLFPNQFVNIKLLIDTQHQALVVPKVAVQQGKKGTFVYLLNKDQTVSVKPVSVKVTNGDFVAVTGEIEANQSVVIEGTDKLTEGTKVTM